MKLYTEEQVKEAIKKSYEPKNKDGNALEYWYSTDEVIAFLTPIELPSDEEIENKAEDYSDQFISSQVFAFEDGAKWMRDKIQGGNK